MTFKELEKEADRLGYKLVRNTRKVTATYLKCKDCKYLTDKKNSLGFLCSNPEKNFKNITAACKSRSAKICKKFAPKEEV